MVDREKVIKGLECCLLDGWETCHNCPYYCGNCHESTTRMKSDALALLKALDVTPEELERLKMCRAECKIDCLLEHYNKVKDELDAMKKAQEKATIEPKRIDLEEETKAWLDKMDAVDALGNIADICIDWDGYRTADGLGGLINEIWAYARYCSDRLAKEQEPVKPKTVQDVNGVYAACGKCDHKLWKMFGAEFTVAPSEMPRFCSSCGQAVKWDE